ncbi:hypothetical protein ACJRO7_017138 [Eucalyptus globulus]|uniref:Uncharacterized protein n=1 Tax=Eucalyptus globulus TaxID=34317 RepID=A0ABD3KQH7_EUCGL
MSSRASLRHHRQRGFWAQSGLDPRLVHSGTWALFLRSDKRSRLDAILPRIEGPARWADESWQRPTRVEKRRTSSTGIFLEAVVLVLPAIDGGSVLQKTGDDLLAFRQLLLCS